MRIAVIQQIEKSFNDYTSYIIELLSEQAVNIGYEIKAWSNVVPAASQIFALNSVVVISINTSSALNIWWWRKLKLPFIKKRIKPDVIILLNTIVGCSGKIPCLYVFDDYAFINKKNTQSAAQKHSASYMQNCFKGRSKIISFSQHLITNLEAIISAKNITFNKVPFTAYQDFHSIELMDKILIKSQFSENREYFVCLLSDEDEAIFITVLKAFSKFKKWQQSSMQLLLIPGFSSTSVRLENKLDAYKYRNDVKLLNALTIEETAAIIASAYALLHVPVCDADVLPAVVGLKSATPVITLSNPYLREYCNNAALYAGENSFEKLGDELIKIFKDETLRAKMIIDCNIQAEESDRKTAAENLWKLIESVAK